MTEQSVKEGLLARIGELTDVERRAIWIFGIRQAKYLVEYDFYYCVSRLRKGHVLMGIGHTGLLMSTNGKGEWASWRWCKTFKKPKHIFGVLHQSKSEWCVYTRLSSTVVDDVFPMVTAYQKLRLDQIVLDECPPTVECQKYMSKHNLNREDFPQ